MSGTFPNSPKFSSLKLQSIQQTFTDRSQSGKRFARKIPGHQWALTAAYDMLTRDQFWPIFAFAMEQDGNYGTFLVVSPELAVPKGTALGSLVVEEVTSATGVYVSGATPNQAALLKPGDVISFAGDLKVYMITQVSEADADGYADVVFRPPLEKTPVYGSAITTHNVAFTMAFAEPLHEYALSSPELFTFEVKLVEAC